MEGARNWYTSAECYRELEVRHEKTRHFALVSELHECNISLSKFLFIYRGNRVWFFVVMSHDISAPLACCQFVCFTEFGLEKKTIDIQPLNLIQKETPSPSPQASISTRQSPLGTATLKWLTSSTLSTPKRVFVAPSRATSTVEEAF